MLVIPPGLSEEEEALQKKFNKLKKKVRGSSVLAGPACPDSEGTWDECEAMGVLPPPTRIGPPSGALAASSSLV